MKKLLILSCIVLASTVSFAQARQGKTKLLKADTTIKYTCPMHPEIVLSKPGKCPKCGMTLVEKKIKAAADKSYTCPMHPEVVLSKPGKCPKCGMTLVEKKAGSMGKMK